MFNKVTASITGIILALSLGGCASQTNKDPLEGFNRGVYKVNDTADKAVIKPIAGAYKAVVPSPLRSGVNNFFDNLGTLITLFNDVLQFKFGHAMDDAGRFVVNSTVGVLGLFDVASMDNIPQHSEDFGQTLGHWGVGSGPYLVLPFIGPSSARDATGFAVDFSTFYPLSYLDDVRTRNQLLILGFIDTRAQYLPASDLLDEAALDPYSFMRDAYLQRRENQVADGNVQKQDDPFFDEFNEEDYLTPEEEAAPAGSAE